MRNFLRFTVLTGFVLFIGGCSSEQPTAPSEQRLNESKEVPNKTASRTTATAACAVNAGTVQQYVRGFGGINMPGWIADLTTDQANKAFGVGAGKIGMSVLRIRVPYDATKFNLEVPTATLAKSLGVATIFATPWTPPASMKSNNNIVGGTLNTGSYSAYAAHLKSFSDYMSSNGAPLYAISVQNEPDITVTYESCSWTSTQMKNFLVNNGTSVGNKLIAAECFQFNKTFTDAILNNSTAASKVTVIGGHIYGGGLSTYTLAAQKGKEVWMTEHYTNTNDANVWSDAIGVGKEIHDCMNAGYSAYTWWYIRRSYGMIDESSNITKRGWIMSQYARFVRPGYNKISATANPASNVYVTAYKSGTKVVIVAVNQNSATSSVAFTISGVTPASVTPYVTSSSQNAAQGSNITVSSSKFTATLAASSVTTFVSN